MQLQAIPTIFIVILLILTPTIVKSNFCDEKTTEAYHSPLCKKSWVVKDPNRVVDVHIVHDPFYHTYSRWIIDKQTYIFAYRDIDYDPNDMVADIYLVKNNSYIPVGIIEIPGYVVNVFTAKLTSKGFQDVSFRSDAGKLQYISIVRLTEGKAEKVFEYGASEIEVKNEDNPLILAKAKTSNIIEQYIWDYANNKFILTKKFPWHK